ncbi:hypothetical protein D3C80_1471080 [compost metagenome]
MPVDGSGLDPCAGGDLQRADRAGAGEQQIAFGFGGAHGLDLYCPGEHFQVLTFGSFDVGVGQRDFNHKVDEPHHRLGHDGGYDPPEW